MKAYLLVLTIFLASNCLINSNPAFYKCKSDLPSDQCATKTVVDAQVTYNLKQCADAAKVCPFKSLNDQTTTVSCTQEAARPSYPGGDCKVDGDCIASATCDLTSSKCKAKEATCKSHDDCEIGKVCLADAEGKKACSSPVADDKTCTESYECLNGSACFKVDDTTSQCKKLFSVENNIKAPDAVFANLVSNDIVSFCKSGFRDSTNVCRELTLKSDSASKACTADADCKYEYTAPAQNGVEFLQNGTETTLAGSCEEGYNSNGAKQCKLANSSTSLNDYITALRTKVLEANQDKCHTKERFDCKSVNADKDLLKDFQTKQVNAIFEHKFKGAESCVKAVLFPYFQVPVINKCPKFDCATDKGDNCAVADGKRSENRKVTLNPCKDNNVCTYNVAHFWNSDNKETEACTPVTPGTLNNLPGEFCEKPEDCQEVTVYDATTKAEKKLKECDVPNKKCKGAAKNERCLNNNSCVAGLYCLIAESAENNKCVDQLEKDSTTDCASTFDCKNGFICLNKKCKEPFTVASGESIKSLDAQVKDFACETGFYQYNQAKDDTRCAQRTYGVEEAKRADKGLVKCDFGSKCNYKVLYKAAKEGQPEDSENTTEDCQCGYNATGQGYCPYASNDSNNIKRYQTIRDNLKSSLNNSRHTVNRFSGFSDIKKSPACKSYWVNPAYRNSVACAIDVLSKFGNCQDVDDSGSSSTSSDTSATSETSSSSNSMMIKFSYLLALIITLALF